MRSFFLIFLFLIVSCKTDREQGLESTSDKNDTIIDLPLEVYDFEGFKPVLKTSTDKIYVLNFWATWCAPCIKEMPYFEALNANYKDQNVEVILVSLDFPKKLDSHLKPFIRRNALKSRVVVLNDSESNIWIPAIDPDWSGAIPATLILSKNKRQFYEQSFTYEELEKELKSFLNPEL